VIQAQLLSLSSGKLQTLTQDEKTENKHVDLH